jgi:hypothetical protein
MDERVKLYRQLQDVYTATVKRGVVHPEDQKELEDMLTELADELHAEGVDVGAL